MTILQSKLMSNAWSGGQYSVIRAILGAYLVAQFMELLSFDADFSLQTTLMLIGVSASFALLIGSHDRIAAYVLAVVWTSAFVRGMLVGDSSPIIVIVLLLLHAFTPPRPFGAWDAKGRVDPDSGWRMPPAVYSAAWIVMIIGIVQAGIGEYITTAWYPASVLVGALFIAALATWQTFRRWLWFGLLCTQIVSVLLGSEQTPNAGLILVQLFTFDPGWVPARAPGHQTERGHTTVYYDGTCGLCHRTIRFLLAEDAAGNRFRYALLDSESFHEALREAGSGFALGKDEAVPDSVVVHRPGRAMLTRAAGALEIGHQLGGLWRGLSVVVGWIPMPILNGGYDFIARVRHRLFKRPTESCPLIPVELRGRFLQ